MIVLDKNSNTEVVSGFIKKGSYWFITTVQPNPKIIAILKEIITTFLSDNDNIHLPIFEKTFPTDTVMHTKCQTIETASSYTSSTASRKISNMIVIGTPNLKR